MQLVLNTYGLQLNCRNRCFQVQAGTESRLISPSRISSILITKTANITSKALLLAAENNIPVILSNSVGQPVVRMHPVMARAHSELRRKQYEFSRGATARQWMAKMLAEKTEGQLSNLAWWANRKPSLAEACQAAKEKIAASLKLLGQKAEEMAGTRRFFEGLHGWEGANARHYWQVVAGLAQAEGYPMEGRSYHPAADGVNATLNYLYGMLYHQVETALACAGLDSQLGLWHRDNFQTPSLSFDIIEPLRPRWTSCWAIFCCKKRYNPTGRNPTPPMALCSPGKAKPK
jgi:CRISPR-associated protein Cas1